MSDRDFPVTIYHNPNCGTSRNTLAAIRAAGYEPQVVEYMKAGWDRPLLDKLLADSGLKPRDLLRAKETKAAELEGASDEAVLQAMVENPVLVNRPIVVTPKGAKLCRPSEQVFELLEQGPQATNP